MTETPEGVVVTQTDRDAATDVYGRFRYGQPPLYTNIAAGRLDHDPIVQAFARHRLAHTPTLRGEEVERLREAYNAVADWPEKRGYPMTVGGQGFMDLLALRNLVGEMLPALSQPLAVDTGQSGEVRPWTAADDKLFPPHQFDRYDRPRTCERCDYVEHDGSGIGWHPCSVKYAATPAPSDSPDPAGEEAHRDDIRRNIIRQLGDDPYADRIILPGTDWDVVLAALASSPIPKTFPREAVAEAWGDRECSGCTLPRRDCECN